MNKKSGIPNTLSQSADQSLKWLNRIRFGRQAGQARYGLPAATTANKDGGTE